MPSFVASIVVVVGIAGLFWLDRESGTRTSPALWIPVVWFLIIGSRSVSQWLQMGQAVETPVQYLEGSPLDAAVFGALLALGTIVLVNRRHDVADVLRSNWPILLFFGYCALSTLWSDYPFVSFKRWIKALGDLVMGLVVLTDPEPATALKRFFSRTGFVLLPLSVLFIKYYPALGRAYNQWTWEPTYVGVTLFKNELGMICMIFGSVAVWRLTSALTDAEGVERRRLALAHATLVACAVWLIWLADSMTSLACFLMASIVILWTRVIARGGRRGVLHLLVLAIVGVAAAALFLNLGGGVLEAMGRDSTLTGRTTVWSIALSVAGNPLVGTGFESFWLGRRLEAIWTGFQGLHLQEAHNGYLEVYLNIGWVGVTLLVLMILTGYRNVLRMFRQNQEAGALRLALFVVAAVYSLTEAGFRMLTPIWTVFLLSTMYVPEEVLVPEQAEEGFSTRGQRNPFIKYVSTLTQQGAS